VPARTEHRNIPCLTANSILLAFPVRYASPRDVFAASSSFVHLHTLRIEENKETAAVVQTQLYTNREVYIGLSLLRDLSFQPVIGLYKNFTRMSPTEFKFLINLIGEQISQKDTMFRKAVPVQERLALTLSSLASDDSYLAFSNLSDTRQVHSLFQYDSST
jgi:hypothetical protein